MVPSNISVSWLVPKILETFTCFTNVYNGQNRNELASAQKNHQITDKNLLKGHTVNRSTTIVHCLFLVPKVTAYWYR